MKITLIKDIEIAGSKKRAGSSLDVANNFGKELIANKKAVKFGKKIIKKRK